jgi:hypothetical protein
MTAQYWYFDSTNNPLMWTSISGSVKINFYGTMPPNPAVFNLPAQCKMMA